MPALDCLLKDGAARWTPTAQPSPAQCGLAISSGLLQKTRDRQVPTSLALWPVTDLTLLDLTYPALPCSVSRPALQTHSNQKHGRRMSQLQDGLAERDTKHSCRCLQLTLPRGGTHAHSTYTRRRAQARVQ
ncbi:hypothetical protein CPLU01_03184 [Colletotrichum plurivorum]|uniref:Uncharacterized protein n=1 Tax=Colletotrichum plurivorum TaxID=2175906 RepID=A0A8H6NLS9_9PEZI|nr:hypothetical protein CPLU01_03184 [Colletotrichum plurivorum]